MAHPTLNRRSLVVLTLAPLALAATTVPVLADDDTDAIREVIRSAYIEGIHLNGSREDIRAGFHPEFVMSVYSDGGVRPVSIEDWIARLPETGARPDYEVTFDVPTVTLVDDTAVAVVNVFFDGRHVYTDLMGLYRFEEGWRIVNKIFQSHD